MKTKVHQHKRIVTALKHDRKNELIAYGDYIRHSKISGMKPTHKRKLIHIAKEEAHHKHELDKILGELNG